MFSFIWHTFFFDPIYNGLVYFIDIVPGGDVGIAIILITVVVKIILLPLSMKAARTQLIMRDLEPKLAELKEKFKNKREEQARKMMELYREAGLNPFSSILLVLIQIPLIIALYFAVARGGGVQLPEINTALLYSFVPVPQMVSMLFFGFIDIAAKSLPLALLAGITQFLSTRITLPPSKPRDPNAEPNFKDDFARSMQLQMRYMLPILIFIISYTFQASIAVYFTVSNLFMIAQEYYIRSKGLKPLPTDSNK